MISSCQGIIKRLWQRFFWFERWEAIYLPKMTVQISLIQHLARMRQGAGEIWWWRRIYLSIKMQASLSPTRGELRFSSGPLQKSEIFWCLKRDNSQVFTLSWRKSYYPSPSWWDESPNISHRDASAIISPAPWFAPEHLFFFEFERWMAHYPT